MEFGCQSTFYALSQFFTIFLKYIGKFENNSRNDDKGTFIWPNGDRYEGGFKVKKMRFYCINLREKNQLEISSKNWDAFSFFGTFPKN